MHVLQSIPFETIGVAVFALGRPHGGPQGHGPVRLCPARHPHGHRQGACRGRPGPLGVALGTTAATFGGIIRDIFAGTTPLVLRQEISVTRRFMSRPRRSAPPSWSPCRRRARSRS
ncbi:TRIC cation channel family protein [Microvirga yunnanensis]|uniref:TRIC cation channel family protein n=1 Tax=Microvirga yunnanensis TaxID=2953740 RepID=UPI0035A0DB53